VTEELFDSIVNIAEEYLGPAAKRFMSRQIIHHLHKNPVEITLEDMPNLVEWVRVTVSLLTEDKTIVDDFAKRLLNLADIKTEAV
jgi:hypothetical protein